MVSTYKDTWRHNPELRHFHRRENLKSHMDMAYLKHVHYLSLPGRFEESNDNFYSHYNNRDSKSEIHKT
jgi:hypothetical protein